MKERVQKGERKKEAYLTYQSCELGRGAASQRGSWDPMLRSRMASHAFPCLFE